MLASVALTCSLCPPCPHSFGRDPDFESWLGNLHLQPWLLPLSHSMFSILVLAFLQFWPYLWPSSVFPFPALPVIRLPICVTTLSLSSLHRGSISWFSFLNAICSSTQICFSVGSPDWGSCFSALTLFRLPTVCIWGPAAISGMSPQVASGHLLFWLHACCCSSSFSALPPLLPLKYRNSQSCRMVLGGMSPQLPMGHLCMSSSHPLRPER